MKTELKSKCCGADVWWDGESMDENTPYHCKKCNKECKIVNTPQSETPRKICRMCGNLLPVSMFHKHSTRKDGFQVWCKPCKKSFDHSARPRNLLASRKNHKNWVSRNRNRTYLYAATQKAKNPKKVKCWNIFKGLVRRGKIIRKPCEVCGNPKTDGHHADHSKPAEVAWLCRQHHIEHHIKLKRDKLCQTNPK